MIFDIAFCCILGCQAQEEVARYFFEELILKENGFPQGNIGNSGGYVHPEFHRGSCLKILEKKVLILPVVPHNVCKGVDANIVDSLFDGQGFEEHSENKVGEVAAAQGLIVDGGQSRPLGGQGLYFVEPVLQEALEPAEGAHDGFKGIDDGFFL